MELRPGYTMTELGVLPEDWEVRPLGEGLSSKPTYGINAPACSYQKNCSAYIRITDITDDGKYIPAAYVQVTTNDFYLHDGDIVLARTGASVGKSYLYKPSDGKLVFAGFLIRIHPAEEIFFPPYVFYCLHTSDYWKWVASTSMRSGQPGINGQEYTRFLLPSPPLPEQHAIAAALSDVDALLDAQERLIAKKRNIKLAAMQQLLTGKTRLPGFQQNGRYKQTELGILPEDWEVKPLGELGIFIKGKGITRSEALSGVLPCIRYGEIYTHHNFVVKNFISFISRDVAKKSIRLEYGDILFTCSGETKEDIGKCASFVFPIEAYAGGDIIILRNASEDAVFLGYRLNVFDIVQQKSSLGQGDAVVHISQKALSSILVSFPKALPEQRAIAAVLSDMDAELAALEARRDKLRAVKQGMMRELLTGRTRLAGAGGHHGR